MAGSAGQRGVAGFQYRCSGTVRVPKGIEVVRAAGRALSPQPLIIADKNRCYCREAVFHTLVVQMSRKCFVPRRRMLATRQSELRVEGLYSRGRTARVIPDAG